VPPATTAAAPAQANDTAAPAKPEAKAPEHTQTAAPATPEAETAAKDAAYWASQGHKGTIVHKEAADDAFAGALRPEDKEPAASEAKAKVAPTGVPAAGTPEPVPANYGGLAKQDAVAPEVSKTAARKTPAAPAKPEDKTPGKASVAHKTAEKPRRKAVAAHATKNATPAKAPIKQTKARWAKPAAHVVQRV